VPSSAESVVANVRPTVVVPKVQTPPPALANASIAPQAKDDTVRVKALLEGRKPPSEPVQDGPRESGATASNAASGQATLRYVVQVGAFAEATAAREARMKVERLGIKTYTQVINNEGGRRIRVRVGPFAQRAAADQAAVKIKQTGLNASVLTL
jgi:DedD protein